jgi:hypothetical protein
MSMAPAGYPVLALIAALVSGISIFSGVTLVTQFDTLIDIDANQLVSTLLSKTDVHDLMPFV